MLFQLLTLVATVIVVFSIHYYVRWWLFCLRLGLRAPLPFPFFGHIPYAIRPGLLYYDAQVIRKYGKMIPFMQGWKKGILVADPDVLKQLQIRDFNSFTDRGSPAIVAHPFSLNLLQLEGARWKKIRSIVTPTFTSAKLKHVFPLIQSVIKEVSAKIITAQLTNEHVEVRKLFGFFTASTISSMAFGLDIAESTAEDRFKMTQFFDDAFNLVSNRNWRLLALALVPFLSFKTDKNGQSPLQLVPESKVRHLKNVLDKVYAERQAGSRRSDFFQMMLDARLRSKGDNGSDNTGSESDSSSNGANERGQKLTKEELFGQASVFMFAGYETTMTALSYCSILLAAHPDVQEACAEEIESVMAKDSSENELAFEQLNQMIFLEAVLREAMRLYTPIRRFFRECTQDTNIAGVEFRKGDMIIIPAHAIHRLPEFWGTDADSFNPNRFLEAPHHDMAYQAFGAGQRSCIGERLAMIEAKAILASILPYHRFVPGEKSIIPPDLVPYTFITRSRHELLLKVEPRKSKLLVQQQE